MDVAHLVSSLKHFPELFQHMQTVQDTLGVMVGSGTLCMAKGVMIRMGYQRMNPIHAMKASIHIQLRLGLANNRQ